MAVRFFFEKLQRTIRLAVIQTSSIIKIYATTTKQNMELLSNFLLRADHMAVQNLAIKFFFLFYDKYAVNFLFIQYV